MSNEKLEQVDEEMPNQLSIYQEIACLVARHPKKCLFCSLAVCSVLTAVAGIAGNIEIENGTVGWKSRGTFISERQMQSSLVKIYKNDLFFDEYISLPLQEENSPWDFMINNVVMGYNSIGTNENNDAPESSPKNIFPECDTSYYFSGDFLFDNNLYAVWGSSGDDKDTTVSILDPDILLQICEAELNTNRILEDAGLCGGCDESIGCLPPFSLIFLLRNYLFGGQFMSCPNLIELYNLLQEPFTDMLIDCANDMRLNFDPAVGKFNNITSCPRGFGLNFVDTNFGVDGNRYLRYTSSCFYTDKKEGSFVEKERNSVVNEMYEIRGEFDVGDPALVTGTYDTSHGDFNNKYTEDVMIADAWYASLSAFVTFLAMIVHTKSLWLSFIGLAQIAFAITVSFFVYHFLIGLKFFPMLNLIGLFVSAALGADDLFVATDKWKNARIKNPESSSEDIAKTALPDAASAMFLTTSTTAVAFFATCICPVPPIFTFAVFCGLMIVFNYVLNCALVFPALCMYDGWLMSGRSNCFVAFSCQTNNQTKEEECESIEANQERRQEGELQTMYSTELDKSLIHRILSQFYEILHKYRWVLLVLSVAAIGVSAYLASTISRPQQSEVRLLPPHDPLEQHYRRSQKLLSYKLIFAEMGADVRAFWGITPADNGDHNNPDTLSNLVLDENFDPSSTEAQEYLIRFCDRLFDNDFVERRIDRYKCEINIFDEWLQNQIEADVKDEGYLDSCAGAGSLPMAEDKFHECIILWSKLHKSKNILSKDGVVKIIRLDFRSPIIHHTQPITILEEEWNKVENWFQKEAKEAPSGVNQMFQASPVWWWYDTNAQMTYTAFGAAGITVGFSAVLVLLASRSFLLTFFSGLCIFYVLAAATASLVLSGWELGFLESVCFAILIGISCDFVIHFGHAYSHLPGTRPKEERTKHALIHMGPSILAAAATSISAALIMLFCHIQFFKQFAEMLVVTMIHAVIGSFFVYFILTDIIGPSQPSKSLRSLISKCVGQGGPQ